VTGIDTTSRNNWTRTNTALTMGCAATFVGAIEVFLFGVLWTQGVYGSRMAWLFGVVLPLLAVTACLGFTAARYGNADRSSAEAVPQGPMGRPHLGYRNPRSAPRLVGMVSLVLIGIPFAFAGVLVVTYGLIVVSHWFH
jgi:hypothetical protein